MSVFHKSKRMASARQQIDIKEVKDGMLILPGDRYRVLLEVTPINFDLRSDFEQDAIIDTYESFLNSIGIPLEVFIRVRELDKEAYLTGLDESIKNEKEDVYKMQLENYKEFIGALIKENKILSRRFYVIIPHEAGSKVKTELIKEQLRLSVDIVKKGFSRLGIECRQLSSLEILDLFYCSYSPTQAKIQPLTDKALELIHSSYIEKEPVT